MISNRRHFQISFPSIPEPIVDVWRTLSSCLKSEKCLPKKFYLSQIAGHQNEFHSEERLQLSSEEVAYIMKDRRLSGFRVNTGHSKRSVDYNLLDNGEQGRQSVLSCRIEENAKALNDWTPLIEGVMQQWFCIGGWQWDSLYYRWQNTSSLEYYESWFGSKPNPLPTYTLTSVCVLSPDRELVDSSKNPGRVREILTGIYFTPSAEMWLGPHFWQYAKCTKEDVLAADFFIEKRDTPHFLYLKSWPMPFSRPDGEQGRIQQKLWKLFFHEDCEWPPGSGTICDEPMYGPPELMP